MTDDALIIKVFAALPGDVLDVMREFKFVLAGGFIRSIVAETEPRDIDLFISKDFDLARKVSKMLSDETVETANMLTTVGRTPHVQLIHGYQFKTVHDLINRFDFTIAQAVMYFDENGGAQLVAGSRFLEDTKTKVLRYTGPLDPNIQGSISRACRFSKLGYEPKWSGESALEMEQT